MSQKKTVLKNAKCAKFIDFTWLCFEQLKAAEMIFGKALTPYIYIDEIL